MSAESWTIVMQGVALGVTLCCTLGPQSIFVLRQGIRGVAAFEAATICTGADLAMIVAGAAGFGALVAAFPIIAQGAGWGSAAFILAYGGKLLADAVWRRSGAEAAPIGTARARSCAIATALALSVLNPQVYLEMMGIVGSVAMRFADADRAVFALGVMLVSPVWFYGLAIGGQRLTTLLGSRRVSRAVDLATALPMLGLGAALALSELGRL
jgi:L-lysine exporter family protein LysE/ArgO